MRKILFVCTGNICRPPSAEAVFRHFVTQEGKLSEFKIDSAGTHGYHVGESPDARAVIAAEERGISMEGIRARKVCVSDFEEFDLIIAMDKGHYDFLGNMIPVGAKAELEMFMDFSENRKRTDVPDPYYGADDGFREVVEMLEEGVVGILRRYL